jgi:hypothetical protein
MSYRSIALGSLLAASFVSTEAAAYPLNPWGSMLGSKTVSLTPYVYTSPGPVVSPYFYAGAGLGKSFDLYAGTAMNFAPASAGGTTFGSVELIPRYFIGGQLGIAPHISWYPGSDQLAVGPEIHYGGVFGKFGITANAGWRPNMTYAKGAGSMDAGTAFAVVAPEIFLHKQFAVYAEVHDYFSAVDSSNSNMLVPGVWFAVDPNMMHSFSVAAQIGLPTADASTAVSAGMWYSTSFGL